MASRNVKNKILALVDDMSDEMQTSLLTILQATAGSGDGLEDLDDTVVRKSSRRSKVEDDLDDEETPRKSRRSRRAADEDEDEKPTRKRRAAKEEDEDEDDDAEEGATIPPLTKFTKAGIRAWLQKIEAYPAEGSIRELTKELKEFGVNAADLEIEGSRAERAEQLANTLGVLQAAAEYIDETMDEDDVAALGEKLGLDDDFSGAAILAAANSREEEEEDEKPTRKSRRAKDEGDEKPTRRSRRAKDEDEDEDEKPRRGKRRAADEDEDEDEGDDDLEDLDDLDDEEDEKPRRSSRRAAGRDKKKSRRASL